MHFSKTSRCLSSVGPEIGIHYLANFRPILNWFTPNVKMEYEYSENIKTDSVNTVVDNLHQIKQRQFLGDTWYIIT